MNIVVIDAVDLSEDQLKELEKLGQVTRYFDSPENDTEILKRAKDADVIVNGWTTFSEEVLSKLEKTKLISLWSTGYDHLNIDAASSNGISVTNVRGYAKNAVSELAIGLMIAVARGIVPAHEDVTSTKKYNWNMFKGIELTGKTLGIIGTGAIGKRVAEIASGFNMSIIAYDPNPDHVFAEALNMKYVEIDEVISNSDILTLHLPLLESTKNFMSQPQFNNMKTSAILINTSRGELMNQEDLVNALERGTIAGAGLDDIVLDANTSEKLMQMKNVVLTPHIGFNTSEAIRVKSDICIENVRNFVMGTPMNVLN